ncbi:hypothetical protein T03_8014 [Trichinella britovi]|uniref:Uncharacterized protein n=1 Tax=Trichinella britovi TaxID=45882 RepID=A0A0V1C653_TRIBR|nr:hypothetical protein T03_8014 [Trichinella britovi]
MELMGALFAARLIRYVQGALHLDIHSLSCWSDSEVTLAWIQSTASQWKPFDRNRVEEIQQLVEPTRWRHCPGKRNPVDVLSRGASLRGISKNCCWWQWTRWLAEPSEAWLRKLGPSESKPRSPPDEGRSPQAALLVSVVTHRPYHGLDPRRYGDVEKLFRITALCPRFVHNCGSAAEDRRSGPLTATKLEASEQVLVRIAQRQAFPKEIEALKRNANPIPGRSRDAACWRPAGEVQLTVLRKAPDPPPERSRGDAVTCSLLPAEAATRRCFPDIVCATATLLDPAGEESRKPGATWLSPMPLGHGAAASAECGRLTRS